MKKIFFIIFCILLIFNDLKAQTDTLIYQNISYLLTTNLNYHDYSLKLYVHQNQADDYLQPTLLLLKKDDQEVFKLEVPNPKYLKINALEGDTIVDINGDKIEELIIEEYSGGAHCCTFWHILALGDEFKAFNKLDAMDGDFKLEDINKDKIYEIITWDYGFAYWNASFSECNPPKVILSYQNGQYLPDAKLMKKKPNAAIFKQEAKLAKQKINAVLKAIPEWNNFLKEDASSRWGFLSVGNSEFDLWFTLLNLVYSGNRTKAKSFVGKAFPEALKPYQNTFWQDFENQLLKCQYLPQGF
jgi:hypothetical protein